MGRRVHVRILTKRRGSPPITAYDPIYAIAPPTKPGGEPKFAVDFYKWSRSKAMFAYELLDENGQTGIGNPEEAHFGLIQCAEEACINRSDKPAFGAYAYAIEEQTHGYKDYVYQLYVKANLRTPDPSGLSYWTQVLQSAGDKLSFLNRFLPEESYGRFVEQTYQALLDHSGDPGGISYWTNRMKTGTTRRSLLAEFCAGAESWSLSGSTNGGYIDRLYTRLLHRSSDPSGKAYWVGKLDAGDTPYSVATQFLDGVEYQQVFVSDQFQWLLDRPADPTGLSYWVGRMQSGASQETVRQEMMTGAEFWNRSVSTGYDRDHATRSP